MDSINRDTLPRGTEPRQSDASMTAAAMREGSGAGAGMGAGAGAGLGMGSRSSGSAGAQQTITQVVIRDHNLVKQLYQEYQQSSAGEQKQALAHRIIHELVQHGGKEEISMYPIMRKKLPNGDALVDRSIQEHQQLMDDLYRLDQMTLAKYPGPFEQCLSKIMTELMQHIQEEENELMPALEKVCSREELIEMANKFESTTVTTRPHPWAPREGVAAAAAHVLSKPLDALRDAMRGDAASKTEGRADIKEKDNIRSM